MTKPKRSLTQYLKWWWNTRVRAIWTVFMPAMKEKISAQRGTFRFEKIAPPLSVSDNTNVTVILTVYKRSQYLNMQIKALREQSVPPDEIWVWCNENETDTEDFSGIADRVICSNSNWKFWGRFAIANLARTEFVAIIDDDILPKPDWIKNCIDTVRNGHDGILGGSGAILPSEGGYSSKHKVGWNGHHYSEPAEVDVICQTWFFSKKHLQHIWREPPDTWENGEDIHFAYMAQKYGDIKCYVPPHPEDKQDMWSCLPDFGKMANDAAAVHKSTGHKDIRSNMVDKYRRAGWKILADR